MTCAGRWRLTSMALCAVTVAPVQAAPGAEPFATQTLVAPDSDRARSIGCMASAIVYEAAHEPVEGREAVAEVIMNRLRSPVYPKTVCGVVYQGSTRRTGCQFTFTCDGSLHRRLPEHLFEDARLIAQSALDGTLPDRVGGATHYHASYVLPRWAASLSHVGRIGAHIFYRASGRDLTALPGALVQRIVAVPGNRPAVAETAAPFLPWGLVLGRPTSHETVAR